MDRFSPSPGGNGRGITVRGPASTNAYYSTYGSEDKIYIVDLKTHASLGTLDTNLETIDSGRSYGALAWDPGSNRLWTARYSGSTGKVGWVDTNTGAITEVFDAHDDDFQNVGLDGLSVDSDGTLWVSADGLGLNSTRIYHYDTSGNIIGSFTVSFGNSGIAVDGDDLWLANIDAKTIHKYSKTGVDSGVSFPTTGLDPEGLTIDNCSFTGKKALWTYSAGIGGGPMAAFEIGDSTNAGCSPTPTPTASPPASTPAPGDSTNPTSKNPSEKNSDDIWTGGIPLYAVVPITFNLSCPLDPLGIIFTYMWNFGDGSAPLSGPYGIYNYSYLCGGFYTVRGSILEPDSRLTNFARNITIGFPSTAIKTYKGTSVSPVLQWQGIGKVKVSLRVDKVGSVSPRAAVSRVDYTIDKKAYNKKTKKGVSIRVTPNRNHTLTVKVNLTHKKAKKRVTIKTCFYL